MDLCRLFILLSLFTLSKSQTTSHAFNHTDFQAAIADMRSKSYFGFAILLQMLNGTLELNQDTTFLMPSDRELSESPIAVDHLDDFLLSHSIPMPLFFSDMTHFPTGTLIPAGLHNRMIRIHNRGRSEFYVNNAQVIAPNICSNSLIKCHGVDAVIEYDNNSNNKKLDKHPAVATPPMHPPTASMSGSFFSGHYKRPAGPWN